MTDAEYTHWARPCVEHGVCEPLKPYRTKRKPKKVKTVTVQKQFYPALKNDSYRSDRPIPWINLRGHWLAL